MQITSAAGTTESHTSFSPGKGAKSTGEGWQTRGQGSVLASEKQVVEEGEHPGSACTWLLTPLQMLQLPSPRRWGGVGGKCGLPQEWRKDAKPWRLGFPFLIRFSALSPRQPRSTNYRPLCADVILRASLYLSIYCLPKGIIALPLLSGALCLAQANTSLSSPTDL